MSLREIARFADVYEAELAGAFLASHGIDVTVTERFQTTVDPLMQRALGIRLMAPASRIEEARALLARVHAGEFATEEGDAVILEPVEQTPRRPRTDEEWAAFWARIDALGNPGEPFPDPPPQGVSRPVEPW